MRVRAILPVNTGRRGPIEGFKGGGYKLKAVEQRGGWPGDREFRRYRNLGINLKVHPQLPDTSYLFRVV